jgi:asparagine synthase (glutamine-hydrolysing)
MCGIFCLFLKQPLRDADIELGRAGTKMLAHRGPDGSGEWFDREAGVYLGHRRLAIIDTSSEGDQPLRHGRSIIAANGEIYNFKDIRKDLINKGEKFQSSGDIEVLLAAWNQWGESILDRVDGMYSFAIWDGINAHLATDPFGEKPLIYAETNDGIYVSSEFKPLVVLLGIEAEITEAQWAAYLNLGYFSAPDTAFKNVFRFGPATYGKISKGSFVTKKNYWTPQLPENGRGPVKPLNKRELLKLRDTLAESIERRLIADVPLALFLSAGIDSALIASIAAKELGKDLSCLTVSFREGDVTDESVHAVEIAKLLGLECRVIEGSSLNKVPTAEDLIDLFTEPSGNIGVFPFQSISEAASKEVKVALSGTGGDEVVWGYRKHEYFYQNRHRFMIPNGVRQLLRPLADFLGNHIDRMAIQAQTTLVDKRETMLAFRNYPAFKELQKLPGHQEWMDFQFPGSDKTIDMEVPAFDMNVALPNDRLFSADLSSMRASIEVRTPYLSRDVVNTIADFDARSLLAYGQKSVLRQILGWYIPEEITSRPKSGFTYPLDLFLSNSRQPQTSHLPPSGNILDMAEDDAGKNKAWQLISVRLRAAEVFYSRYSSN